jgi:hypothetical protein
VHDPDGRRVHRRHDPGHVHRLLYSSVGETEATIKAKIAADLLEDVRGAPDRRRHHRPGHDGQGLPVEGRVETIKEAYPDHTFRVVMTLPAGDTALAAGECAVLGTVTGSVVFQVAP